MALETMAHGDGGSKPRDRLFKSFVELSAGVDANAPMAKGAPNMEGLTLAATLLLGSTLTLGALAARRARRTSLAPAACWDAVAVACVTLVELTVARSATGEAAWVEPARWAVASAVFCGWMSRLGARRPHNAGWQWVVASLWAVLALPAAEVFFLQRGQTFEIHAARSWFLVALVLGGLVNSLPTRDRLAGLLAAAAQILLVAPHLPGLGAAAVGFGHAPRRILGAALLLVVAQALRLTAARSAPRPGLDGLWLDFRDQFGAWWAVRIREAVNAAARDAAWPVRLGWNGFHAAPDAPVPDAPAPDAPAFEPPPLERLAARQSDQLRQTLWNLLRRFVEPDWVAGRLGETPARDAGSA